MPIMAILEFFYCTIQLDFLKNDDFRDVPDELWERVDLFLLYSSDKEMVVESNQSHSLCRSTTWQIIQNGLAESLSDAFVCGYRQLGNMVEKA